MEIKHKRAEEILANLDRWCDLKVTFLNPEKEEIVARCYVIDKEEDMWSLFIKQFNLKDWYREGTQKYLEVFESCQGSKRCVVYIHTELYALRLITKEHIPVGSQIIGVDYL